jgi:tRNA(Ile)-lysidine synthase TilS/MesJ
MCKLCNEFPVYEFTNKRKLCKRCFLNWFEKKFLYTNRRFSMMKQGEIIVYKNKEDLQGVVLESLLKKFSDKIGIKLFKSSSKKKYSKIAIPETTDSESDKIIHAIIRKNIAEIDSSPKSGKKIKPLYLFLDKEVELYAKIKKINYKNKKNKKNKISFFIEKMEKEHPEVKQAIIGSYLKLREE